MIPTIDDMDHAMNTLAETDAQLARGVAAKINCEIVCKRSRARAFLLADGSADVRKAHAEEHADVVAADDLLVRTIRALETLKAKRETAERVIDVYRTLEASRRKA